MATEVQVGHELLGSLSGQCMLEVEPVGRWFKSWWWHHHHHRATTDGYSLGDSGSQSEEEEDLEATVEIEDDVNYLRSLDPKEWKDQDHYAVLGLKKYRCSASEEDIKRAYRQKVLRHHPDKRKAAGEEIRTDDDYFTCITKAYETLSNPARRRAYDSVDPEFDDEVPSVNSTSKSRFFEVFGPVIEANSRWSVQKPVPQLGTMETSRDDVEAFYDFWYNFESWREFSYLDEEEKDKGQDREERRWIEKQNKAERLRRKKEEMSRIRSLVDAAYACDPRIAKFKEEERQRKADAKKARQDAIRARQEEEERKRREEEQERLRQEREAAEAERAKLEAAKREKEAAKRALKRERKRLKTFCKDRNYFATNDAEIATKMADLDKLCELLSCEELEKLNGDLESSAEDVDLSSKKFSESVERLNRKLAEEKEQLIKQATASISTTSVPKGGSSSKGWSPEELQLLIKAVNLFPAGTNQRWEVVANFINQHHGGRRTAKEVLAQAKELQNSDFSRSSLREAANKAAYENFEKVQTKTAPVVEEAKPSERYETPAEQMGVNLAPWSADEQKLLEQALKTFPASVADRWDRIAETIPNRSKKDCMKRYKELVELVRAKKNAQAAVSTKPAK